MSVNPLPRPASRRCPSRWFLWPKGRESSRSARAPAMLRRMDKPQDTPTLPARYYRQKAAEDGSTILGYGDLPRVDCAVCLPSRRAADTGLSCCASASALSPHAKVLDLQGRVRCCGCRTRGRPIVSVKWAKAGEPRCLSTSERAARALRVTCSSKEPRKAPSKRAEASATPPRLMR
jgi:hypothetical protein